MQSRHYMIATVAFVVGLALGAAAMYGFGLLTPSGSAQYNAGVTAGSEAAMRDARAKLEASGLVTPTVEAHELTGRVESVSNGAVNIMVGQLSSNPFEAPTPEIRTVRITSSTKIMLVTSKDPEKRAAEEAAYTKSVDAWLAANKEVNAAPLHPPLPPDENVATPAGVADIKEGMIVRVTSEQDIRAANSFDATEIRMSPLIDVPPSPPLIEESVPVSNNPSDMPTTTTPAP